MKGGGEGPGLPSLSRARHLDWVEQMAGRDIGTLLALFPPFVLTSQRLPKWTEVLFHHLCHRWA